MTANYKTALCLTPDRAFFRQAVSTAAAVLAQEDGEQFDLFVICEDEDVAPGFERLAAPLRARIRLKTLDFRKFDRGLDTRGRLSRAVFRRLFLDRILPDAYERIVSLDSDMWITRPGLGRLTEFDLGGAALAAAYDMIFLMDFGGGALARSFQRQRVKLGLSLTTPYFNAGLMAIDRQRWAAMRVGDLVIEALSRNPKHYPFYEQSALNEFFAGDFAPLSPRYNFMGDFFLLDLETKIAPIVLHFVNAPKPWQYELWRGEKRFAEDYSAWFAASPWPELSCRHGELRQASHRPRQSARRRAFAQRLLDFLETRQFIDGWRPSNSLGQAGQSTSR
jgi:lipopolysaccharide biosynthesis glycosyltransferase